MEAMRHYHQLVKTLLQQVGEQRVVLKPLGDVFTQEAQRLFRYDQAICLRRLKARVLHEIGNIQSMEIVASYGFTKATIFTGVVKFVLGGLVAAVTHSRKALSIGAYLAESDISRTQPFGKVLVALGRGGLPNDVTVIPVSRLARELNSPQSNVEAALEAHGYFLMTPDSFSLLVDKLKGRVLDGSLALPIAGEQLRAEWHPADAISQ